MASRATRQHLNLNRVGRRCLSQKVCYGTYTDAQTGAEQVMALGHVNVGCHLTPYLCDECDRWHIWNRPIVFPTGRSATW